MNKNSKKALYEKIMRNVSKQVKQSINALNESNVATNMSGKVYDILFNKVLYCTMSVDDILKDQKILKKIAGSIVEARVKDTVRYAFTENYQDSQGYHAGTRIKQDAAGMPRYVDGGDNWWDFMLDGEKVEIKAFQKGKMYSNVHATKNQVDMKNDLTFMLVEYKLHGTEIIITGIAFVDGKDIEFDSKYNRLVNNGNIEFLRDSDDYQLSSEWDEI